MRKELMRDAIRKEAKRQAIANGIDFEQSWDLLTFIQRNVLLTLAKWTHYGVKYDPNCYLCKDNQISRAFFYHLKNKVEL